MLGSLTSNINCDLYIYVCIYIYMHTEFLYMICIRYIVPLCHYTLAISNNQSQDTREVRVCKRYRTNPAVNIGRTSRGWRQVLALPWRNSWASRWVCQALWRCGGPFSRNLVRNPPMTGWKSGWNWMNLDASGWFYWCNGMLQFRYRHLKMLKHVCNAPAFLFLHSSLVVRYANIWARLPRDAFRLGILVRCCRMTVDPFARWYSDLEHHRNS